MLPAEAVIAAARAFEDSAEALCLRRRAEAAEARMQEAAEARLIAEEALQRLSDHDARCVYSADARNLVFSAVARCFCRHLSQAIMKSRPRRPRPVVFSQAGKAVWSRHKSCVPEPVADQHLLKMCKLMQNVRPAARCGGGGGDG